MDEGGQKVQTSTYKLNPRDIKDSMVTSKMLKEKKEYIVTLYNHIYY